MKRKLNIQSKAFTLIELMIILAILSILTAIAIPNFIAMRDKGFCTSVESDADQIAKALADYFALPNHNQIPDLIDLKLDIHNKIPTPEITGDLNSAISIKVTDRSHRCPVGYQNTQPQWKNFVYTKTIQ